MIKWLANKLLPYFVILFQNNDLVNQTLKRLDALEKDSHPPLFDKGQLNKIHKRIEDLETVAFVNKFGEKMKHYEGTD